MTLQQRREYEIALLPRVLKRLPPHPPSEPCVDCGTAPSAHQGVSMTPLDAARRLADQKRWHADDGYCLVCDGLTGDWGGVHHKPDCPVPMLPQIVAALEAAGDFAEYVDGLHWGESPDSYAVREFVKAVAGEAIPSPA